MAGWLPLFASGAPTGRSLINGFYSTDFPFKNFLKMSGLVVQGGAVDANGYPTTAAAGSGIHIPYPAVDTVSSSAYKGRYRIAWNGTGHLRFNAPGFIYDGGAAAGLGGNTGRTSNITIDGNINSLTPSGFVEFDFSWNVTGSAPSAGAGSPVRLAIPFTAELNASAVCVVSSALDPGANGTFAFTIDDDTHVTLTGSVSTGTFGAGGSFQFFPLFHDAQFGGGSTPSSWTNLALCRASAPYAGDLAAVQGGVLANQFNDDFIANLTTLNPNVLRLLDNAGFNNGLQTRNAYVSPVSALSYSGETYPPSAWAGSATLGTGYAYACSAATDTPVSWTDGEIFQTTIATGLTTLAVTAASAGASNGAGGNYVRITVSSTANLPSKVSFFNASDSSNGGPQSGTWSINVINGTQLDLLTTLGGVVSVYSGTMTGTLNVATINVGTRGARIMTNGFGNPFQTFFQSVPGSGTQVTCVYDALQDVVLVLVGGIRCSWPVEVRIALCNKVNKNYWHSFPGMYDLQSVATETALISSSLNSNLKCYFERGNEEWNFGFLQALLGVKRANALGFLGNDLTSYHALKHRQFMGQVATSWGARSATQMRRVLQWRYGSLPDPTLVSLLFNGSVLVGATYPLYLAYVGGTDPGYNSAPNRPADVSDDFSYAPYYNGMLEAGGVSTGQFNALDFAGLTTAADNFALGTAPGIAAAFAWLDNDIRQGTRQKTVVTNAGGTTFSATGHPFNNNDQVMVSTTGTIFSPLSVTTRYFIVNKATNTFQLSATQGGAAISVSGGSGTQTVGILLGGTLLSFVNDVYPAWVAAAQLYSPNKGIISYEGGPSLSTISQAQCTAAGISTTYGTTSASPNLYGFYGGPVWNMLIAYKHDALFQATVYKQFTDQVAALAGTIPGVYTYGNNATSPYPSYPWSLESNDLYSAFYKTYDAMVQFNS